MEKFLSGAFEKLSVEVLEEGASLIGVSNVSDVRNFINEFEPNSNTSPAPLASLLPTAAALAAYGSPSGEPGGGDGAAGPGAAAAAAAARRALDFWRQVDLTTRREAWDAAGAAIAQAQEASRASQPRLGELVRDAKAALGPEAAEAMGPLLGAFRAELDRLTKRARGAEGTFLEIYGALREAPDPTGPLAAALEASNAAAAGLAAAGGERGSLREDLAAARAELERVRGAVTAAMRAEEKAAAAEAEVDRRVAAAAEAARRESEPELEAARTATAAAAARATELAASLSALQRQHETTQSALFDASARAEALAGGRAAELESALEELEAALGRVAVLERANVELHEQLQLRPPADVRAAAAEGAAADGGGGPAGTDGASGRPRDRLVARLHDELRAAEAARATERTAAERAAAAAAEAADVAAAELDSLRAELARRPRREYVDRLKARVRVLRAVSGGEDDGDDDEDEAGGTGGGGALGGTAGTDGGAGARTAGAGGATSLVTVALNDKCRRLGSELAAARAQAAAAAAEGVEARARVAELEAASGRQLTLIGRLEADLMRLRPGSGAGGSSGAGGDKSGSTAAAKAAAGAAAAAGGAGTAAGSAGAGPAGVPAAGAGAADLFGERGADASAGEEEEGDAGGEATFLAIVCGQRERLRQRVETLEEDLGRARDGLAKAAADLAAARADNVGLFEKIKYLSSYQYRSGAGGGPGGAPPAVDGAGVPLTVGGAGGAGGRQRRYECGPVTIGLDMQTLQIGGGGGGAGDGARRRGLGRYNCFGGGEGEAGAADGGEAGAAGGTGAESRYSKAYAERLNPFTAFMASEAEQARGKLRLHDRLALGASRLIASNGPARLGAVLYVLALHVMMLMMLYRGAGAGAAAAAAARAACALRPALAAGAGAVPGGAAPA